MVIEVPDGQEDSPEVEAVAREAAAAGRLLVVIRRFGEDVAPFRWIAR